MRSRHIRYTIQLVEGQSQESQQHELFTPEESEQILRAAIKLPEITEPISVDDLAEVAKQHGGDPEKLRQWVARYQELEEEKVAAEREVELRHEWYASRRKNLVRFLFAAIAMVFIADIAGERIWAHHRHLHIAFASIAAIAIVSIPITYVMRLPKREDFERWKARHE